MTYLRLHFESLHTPTLAKSEFVNSRQSILAVRGKSGGALPIPFTFQWSGGVKGLTVLALRHRLFGELQQPQQMVISGERGSLAVALDSAIAKSSNWLCEMLGADAAGTPVAKRLIRRTNPERKRPGPVVLGFSQSMFPPNAVEIHLDGRKIDDSATLFKLLESLEQCRDAARIIRTAAAEADSSPNIPSFAALLRKACRDELLTVLRSTPVFSRRNMSAQLERATAYASMREFLRMGDPLVSEIDLSISPSGLLGAHDATEFTRTFGDEPLTAAVLPTHPGAVAVLQRFGEKKGIPLDLQFQWETSTQLVHEIVSGAIYREPDLLTLNIGAAAWLKSKRHLHNYEVLMLMPNFSHRVITPKAAAGRAKELSRGTYHIMYQIPSSTSLVFEELQKSGRLAKNRIGVQETNLSEMAALMTEGDSETRAIVPFPFWSIFAGCGACDVIDFDDAEILDRQSVLCVHRRIFENRRKAALLDIALRDAWLELIENPQLLDGSIDRLVTQPGFRSMVERISGIHRSAWKPMLAA